ncbi:tripartite tricarboxylate transporter substrate binding protein [Pusillimonas sp. ANT_WB101]|uniref:Bug family tripartite tricarboxylate transporter substrate binding protein n=1 Tax=Pusillimonas sp. ANT_WB101 TaxID=2597356 RepID=UPI0011EC19F5|nr:tripartite tricarboxylate transporter substrate binding protein [Pusillimonas sp. ANT_WB101]KAA0911293.1 tripartite tricarboxylate transporter substrate binding protein [Pusillimonas sp. ANT_WB101]
MIKTKPKSLLAIALMAGTIASAFVMPAHADAYPQKPITIVVPFPPGGTADGFTRGLAQELGKRLGQSVIVDNRPGANGILGSAYAADRPADGYTILYGSGSTLAVNPYIYPVANFDPLKDMVPLVITHQMPNVLVVGESTTYQTVQDLIADGKANPDKLSFASAGTGNSMHLAGEQFKTAAGIEMLHIPYKGSAESLNDIMGGRVPLMFNNLPSIVGLVKSGKLRALAVTDSKRSPLLPDVPTMEEAGVPGFTNVIWVGLVMRNGTDPKIINRLSTEIRDILKDPEFSKPTEALGYEIIASTPEEMNQVWQKDSKEMGDLTQKLGIRVN